MIKRSQIGVAIMILSGVTTFLFLANLTAISGFTRDAYRMWLRRLLWPSIFLLVISAIGSNRLSEKVIFSDKAYEIYRKARYELIDNMGLGELKYTKISLLVMAWLTYAFAGVVTACIASRIVLGG